MNKEFLSRLSIVFVTNNYTPYSGGVVSSIVTATEALKKEGHTVTIITLDFMGTSFNNEEPDVIRILCPIRFVHKKNRMAIPWRPTDQIKKIISALKPDIIHAHHPFLLGSSAVIAARIYRIPVVFTYHTMYEKFAHYLPLPEGATRFVTMWLVNNYCRRVDAIVAPSDFIKKDIEQRQIATPITIVPSSIDPRFLTKTARAISFDSTQPFHLLCVSRFAKEKKIHLLLDAFTRIIKVPNLSQSIFTLIGYGHEFDALQRYAYKKCGLSKEQVRFIHKPDKKVIEEYYKAADLFLFSSPSDTQGLVLAEAMGAGMPVIALDGPGQQSIIKNGINGFLVHSIDEMVAMIAQVAKDPLLHQSLSDGAWHTAQKYAPDCMARQLVDLYRNLCR